MYHFSDTRWELFLEDSHRGKESIQSDFCPFEQQEITTVYLSICGIEDWETIQMGVVGACLYGNLKENIYMKHPNGFVDKYFDDHVWQLYNTLYGLKQSERQWHARFLNHVRATGLKRRKLNL